VHGTREVLNYWTFWIIRWCLQWHKFFKTSQPAIRESALVSYFHFLERTHSFAITAEPGMGFPTEQLLLTLHVLSSCVNFGFLNVCCLKVLHTFIWCHKPLQLALTFCTSYTVDNSMLSEAITSLQFQDFKVSAELLKLHVSFCHWYLVYSLLDFLKPL